MDFFGILTLGVVLLGSALIAALLAYNAFQVDSWERREVAMEMREAMRWASLRKMRQQHDYKAVLRGK